MGVQFFCIPFFVMPFVGLCYLWFHAICGLPFLSYVTWDFHAICGLNEILCIKSACETIQRLIPLFIVPHAAMSNSRRSEDAPRTRGGRFRYRISLPYRRSLFFTPNASENASRTPGSLFVHRVNFPYQRRPSPVPNFSNCQKKESIARAEYNKRQKGRGPFLCSALPKTRRVHQKPGFCTARIFRTIGGRFRYRISLLSTWLISWICKNGFP